MEITTRTSCNRTMAFIVARYATHVGGSADAPIDDSTKTGVSHVVGSEQIQSLPINGRRVDSFVLLTPAVVQDGTFGLIPGDDKEFIPLPQNK